MVLNPIKAIASRLSPSSTHNGPTSAPSSNSRSPRNPVPAAAPVTHRGRQYSAVAASPSSSVAVTSYTVQNAYKAIRLPDDVVYFCTGIRPDIEDAITVGVKAFEERRGRDAVECFYNAANKALSAAKGADSQSYKFAYVTKICLNLAMYCVKDRSLNVKVNSQCIASMNGMQKSVHDMLIPYNGEGVGVRLDWHS